MTDTGRVGKTSGLYTAAEVARKSGLGRTLIYYLAGRGLLKPVGRTWERMRFDEDAVRMAEILSWLQRRGVGAVTAVRTVDAARTAYGRRMAAERIQPLEQQIGVLTNQVWELLG